MELEMLIKQADNGWILIFTGHNCLEKTIICKKWVEVFAELDDYFGWYGANGEQTKVPNK